MKRASNVAAEANGRAVAAVQAATEAQQKAAAAAQERHHAEFEAGAAAGIEAADARVDNLSRIVVKRHVTIAGELLVVAVGPGVGLAVIGNLKADAQAVAAF